MLDLNQLITKQNEGNRLLDTLQAKESVILQNYGLMAAQALTEEARTRHETVTNLILNAFRNGICLGLGIQIAQGEIQKRS